MLQPTAVVPRSPFRPAFAYCSANTFMPGSSALRGSAGSMPLPDVYTPSPVPWASAEISNRDEHVLVRNTVGAQPALAALALASSLRNVGHCAPNGIDMT